MKICAIIAEYNPFHNGHLYQIEKYRQAHDDALMIAIMSGNFVQRGEPALVDKWTRAQMALHSGIDIVIELPLHSAVQSADFFAYDGVNIASQIGAQQLLCGVESGSGPFYMDLANEWTQKHRMQERLQRPDLSLTDFLIQENTHSQILTGSNNILAFCYAKAIKQWNAPIELVTINRQGQDYNDCQLTSTESMMSATAIRHALLSGGTVDNLKNYLPDISAKLLDKSDYLSWERFWPYLKYQLLVMSAEELSGIFQMESGLEYRLKEAALGTQNFAEFLGKIRTKRYSDSRLRRLCLYVLLNIRNHSIEEKRRQIQKWRILGFTSAGQDYLSHFFKNEPEARNRFITKIGRDDNESFSMDICAGRIYQLARKKDVNLQDFKRKPLKIN